MHRNKRQLKLLILTPNYPRKNKEMNGVFIHQQVKALQQLGVECHVLLLHGWFPPFQMHKYHALWSEGYRQKKEYFDEYEGVKIHHIPVVTKMPDRIFRNNYPVQAAKAIVRYISSKKELSGPHWLYAHFFTDSGYIATMVKEQLNIKLAVIARGDDIHAWPLEKPELVPHLHEVFKKADVLLANSGGLAADTRQWMDNKYNKTVDVVYNGVDHTKFRPGTDAEKSETLSAYGLELDCKYMICVSTPVKLKGWLELLNAIAALKLQLAGWKLLVVAPNRVNNDALNLQQIAADLGISDIVQHMGQLHPNDVARLLRACDVFILPSYNEGMANALLEAMASGIACIATNVGGHKEVVENGVTGILVEPKSEQDLKDAIEQLVNNNNLRVQMGIGARERMLKFGDYGHNAKKLLSILNDHSNINN